MWRSLLKQVQYQTFNVIIDYLKKSNKITFSKENKIVWIATNQKLDLLVKKGKIMNKKAPQGR